MARPRDSMWTRVLTAERDTAKQLQLVALNPPSVTVLLGKIERSTWWKKRRPNTRLKLVSMRSGGSCTQDWTTPINARTRLLQLKLPARPTAFDVCHAIAHHLVVDDTGTPDFDTAWHGPEFTRAMLELVRRFVGQEEHALLRTTYLDRGVRTRAVAREIKERNKQQWVARDLQALLDELR